jgi:hypothetical protein
VLQVAEGSYAHTYALEKGIQVEVREYVPVVVDSGNCGDSASWTLYDTDTLEISGSGAMTNYVTQADAPWDAYRSSVKNVIIGKDITSIGANTFCHMYNLINVSFEAGSRVETIGDHAFHYTLKLASIILPDNVKGIGFSSFGYGRILTSIYLPDGVTNINDMAFWNHNANLTLSVAAGSPAYLYALANGIAVNVRGELPDPNVPLYVETSSENSNMGNIQ